MTDAGGTSRCGRRARRLGVWVAIGLVTVAGAPTVAAAAEAGTDDSAPLVIAHRGASAVAPEHTFAAYDRAVEQQTDILECDLQLTADDVLVCMHDTTVDRTTGGSATGRVGDYTLEQLRAMDFGSWFGPEYAGASIVPFEEQLRCYSKIDPDLQFEAETKAPSEYGGRMEPALVELLDRLDLIPDGPADLRTAPVIIQSFERPSLDAVKLLAPSLPTAWLFIAPPPEVSVGAIPDTIDAIAPAAELLQGAPQLVEQAHFSGKQVQAWTVDDPAVMDELLDDGVDAIFSNDPATLRARVDSHTGAERRPAIDFERGCPGVAGSVTALAATSGVPSTDAPAVTPLDSPPPDASTDLPDWARATLIGLTVAAIVALVAGAAVRRRRPP